MAGPGRTFPGGLVFKRALLEKGRSQGRLRVPTDGSGKEKEASWPSTARGGGALGSQGTQRGLGRGESSGVRGGSVPRPRSTKRLPLRRKVGSLVGPLGKDPGGVIHKNRPGLQGVSRPRIGRTSRRPRAGGTGGPWGGRPHAPGQAHWPSPDAIRAASSRKAGHPVVQRPRPPVGNSGRGGAAAVYSRRDVAT